MANSWGGLAAVALFVAWLAYYVPGRVGIRQQLVDARTSDRFSGGLRVLAVAGGTVPAGPSPAREHTSATRLVAHDIPNDHGSRKEGPEMASAAPVGDRPGRPRTVAASSPARRRAAARRRLTLTLALGVLTVAMCVGAAFGVVLWPVVVVPVVFLAIVLVLGRRAVVSGRRAEEARFEAARARAVEQRRAALGAPPIPRAADRHRVTGHAVHASQHATQMIPRVTAADLERAARRVAPPAPRTETSKVLQAPATTEPAARAGLEPSAVPASPQVWDPVPVPPPTYALKAAAPRPVRQQLPDPLPEPLPAPVAETDLVGLAAPGTVSADVRPEPPVEAVPETAGDEPRPRTETLGLSLDAILARRRASGE